MPANVYDLVAFQRALKVIVVVRELSARFPVEERYGLTSQIRRASYGVCSHLAEGQGRLTFGEWRQFLSQARGSLYEVEAHGVIAQTLGFINDVEQEKLRCAVRPCAAALGGLIRWVQRKEQNRQPGNRATGQPINEA